MRLVPTVFRALPLGLALLTVAADSSNCNIIVNNDEDEGDDDDDDGDCADLDDLCPNLACDNGNVLDADGCAICECNSTGPCDIDDAGPVPECANPIFDDQRCAWSCGSTGECFSDADCGPGAVCEFTDCGAVDDAGEAADCGGGGGFCVEVRSECFADSDCGDGFRCDFSGGGAEPGGDDEGGGGQGDGGSDDGAPPPDGDDDAAERPAPAPGGQCVPVEQRCTSDDDCDDGAFCDFLDAAGGLAVLEGECRERPPVECIDDSQCADGQHCEFLDNAGAVVARAGVCVDDPPASCDSDDACGPGERCVETCQPDPNCPECDVCLLVGQCLPVDTACDVDGDCRDGEVCKFSDGADRALPCFDDDGDGQCDDVDPAPGGVCVPADDGSCSSDDDCDRGQRCELGDSCVCDALCRDDGNGGCLPCACPEPAGRCVDVVVEGECFQDEDCEQGQVCQLFDVGCDSACTIDENGEQVCFPCDPIPAGVCVTPAVGCASDDDCRDDEQCVFDEAAPPECDGSNDGFACRPAPPPPQGTCQPRDDDPCDCRDGDVCRISADGSAICEPAGADCTSDGDCADDELCSAGEDCLPDPACDPDTGVDCTAVCHGTCFDPRD
jgi:hypothetical protein